MLLLKAYCPKWDFAIDWNNQNFMKSLNTWDHYNTS